MGADRVIDASAAQRRALQWQRGVATALLVASGVGYVVATASGLTGFWIQMLRAGLEAAMVGGLADWFAVTALFRHPLGLPIPHTAVIPRNKDRIAASLGRFIESNFLEPDLVASRVRLVGPARLLGTWFAKPANADAAARSAMTLFTHVYQSLSDERVRRQLLPALHRQLQDVQVAPASAVLLESLKASGVLHDVFDHGVAAVRGYIVENRDQILAVVERRSFRWIPGWVDQRIATVIADGLSDYLDQVTDRAHPTRRTFDAAVDRTIGNLRESPELHAKLDGLWSRLLEAPAVRGYLEVLLKEIRLSLEADLTRPDSRVRAALADLIETVGSSVANDAAAQERMDRHIEAVIVDLVAPSRAAIGRFVSDVVRGWDTRTMVRRVELEVGRDLQYIRINGTVVGAVVGVVIFALTHFLAGS